MIINLINKKSFSGKLRILGLFLIILAFIVSTVSSMTMKRKIRIMPLGDSITGSQSYLESYRYWLWKKLTGAGFQDKIEFVGIRCGSGDNSDGCVSYMDCSTWSCKHNGFHDNTIEEILGLISKIMDRDTADIVIIHLGTNDITRNYYPVSTSKIYMGAIIDSIRSRNPDVSILLSKIIPMKTPNQSLIDFNIKMEELANEKNTARSPVKIVDQFTGYNPDTNNMDEVHPNASGEKRIADKFYNAILPLLNSITSISTNILSPSDQATFNTGNAVTIQANANAYPKVNNLKFIVNNSDTVSGSQISDSLYGANYQFSHSGFFNIVASVSDAIGNNVTSTPVTCIVPENSSTMNLSIMDIQGAQERSVYENYKVITSGVITFVTPDQSGFWIQDTMGDHSDLTSDAIFVNRNTGNPAVLKGDYVEVRGIVQEYQPCESCMSVTRITGVTSIVKSGTVPLPPPVVISYILTQDSSNVQKNRVYQANESMRVSIRNAVVTSPSPNASIIAQGNQYPGAGYYAVEGVAINEQKQDLSIDYNPEIVQIGNDGVKTDDLRTGDTLYNLHGVLSYNEKGQVTIVPDSSINNRSAHKLSAVSPVSVRYTRRGILSIVTMNLGGVFDTLDTWGKNDTVVTPVKYIKTANKIKRAIIDEMKLPGILCVQNIENNSILKDIASRVNLETHRGYKAYSLESTEYRGLENGFLYDSLLFSLSRGFLLNGSSIDSAFGTQTQQPLAGVFRINNDSVMVLNIDLITNDGDNPRYGSVWPWVRGSEIIRNTQAVAIRQWITSQMTQYPNRYMVVAGELNDYPFDEVSEVANPLKVISGSGSNQTLLNIWQYLPTFSRYSSIKNGRAQMTSTISVNQSLSHLVMGWDVLHFNSRFEDKLVNDETTAARCGISDAIEIRF